MKYVSLNDWSAFVKDRHKPPLRECIHESWLRCAGFGLDPFSMQAPAMRQGGPALPLDEFSSLIKSLVDRPLKGVSVSSLAWMICGPEGDVRDIGSYNPELAEFMRASGLVPGAIVDERGVGTSAIGLAMQSGQPSICHGPEHFLKKYHCLSAAAAPFYSPDGALRGFIAMCGFTPESDALHLRVMILLLIQLFDREMRVNRFKELYRDIKRLFTRMFNDDLKPAVMVNRNCYIRQMNPAAMKFFELHEKNMEEKNLDKLADFEPSVRDLAQSAIPCCDKKMEIKVSDRHVFVTCDKIPVYSENDEFLGNMLVFNEKGEKSGAKSSAVSEAKYTFDDIIGRTPSIVMARELAERAAKTSVNILLAGPSGTGKEMFAHSIHNSSDRSERPFVAINCAAIPREIAESELFGYAHGAFTGASRGGQIGRLEAADKGTVFFDEIGDMPMELQAKLLRLLEDRTITRIGERKETPINIRIIAATNKDIPALIEEGLFREDLYYRLNVSSIRLPPLSDSADDIPELIQNFIEYFNEKMGKKVLGIDEKIMKSLKAYSWPGNIRELRNAIEFAVMLNSGEDTITLKDLPGQLRMALLYKDPPEMQSGDPLQQERMGMENSEKALYQKAVRLSGGNMSEAAKILDVGRSTLYRKLKKFGLKI